MAVDNFFAKFRQDLQWLKGSRHGSPQDEQKYAVKQKSRARRSGLVLYSGLLFWALLLVWTLLNLLVSRFPAELNMDVSDDRLYSLSEATENILSGLEQEVTIYALFSPGQRPTQPLDIYRYLELYASSGPYIRVEEVDPTLDPDRIRPFITGEKKGDEYQGRGDNKAPQRNSLIVFTRGAKPRFRVIRYSELYYVTERFGPKNAGIRAEQQISAAIAYVNGANVARLGLLRGHREQNPAVIRPNFEQFNIAAESIQLLPDTETSQGLEDLDVLLVYKPQLDLSEAEYRLLGGFLERGGALWLMLDFQTEHLPRFYQLARDYGMEIMEGLVLERDPKRIRAGGGYTTFISPISRPSGAGEPGGVHPIIRPLQDNEIADLLWVQSMAVRESLPHSRSLRFYSLAESSPSSLLRTSRDPTGTVQSEDDIGGPLTLMGMTVWQDEQGRRSGPAVLVSFDVPGPRSVFSTPGNLQLFYSALSWLGQPQQGADGAEAGQGNGLIFPSKSLLMLPMRLSQAQAIWWAAIFVVLIPLLVLLAGFVFLRRRKHL
ncbi:GldG family protein [Candidatus Haliotispira prima]|uniref:GldG family protein n=1 Tax=Candidatus Haliotispira prima TaxID=3034016 RepID=A0ABY8MI32_9SPIO|nr:GldG family protein [Candidatus Haliotispira prima]